MYKFSTILALVKYSNMGDVKEFFISVLKQSKVFKKKVNLMAYHALIPNFSYFFKRLNPSPTFVQQAASQHSTIIPLIENKYGLARELSPKCFLQGSYKQQTAIYTINDIDIVALCNLWFPGEGVGNRSWSRDQIFYTIAAPLLDDGRYANKVQYHSGSMCIKIDLGIKIEILPVVYQKGNYNFETEPFILYRQRTGKWEEGYARYHQAWFAVCMNLSYSIVKEPGNGKRAMHAIIKHG
ncbi:MAG: hypothetical protein M1609_01955 [Firmicutes bacterium]|nr:hypothetical protein [Bacillota bacterium]